MALPRVRQQPTQLESSTRIKRGEATTDLDDRDGERRVEMKIPRGMPVLPGGRRMPPLPVVIRESLRPLRRSLAPLLQHVTTRSAERVSEVTPIGEVLRPQRLRVMVVMVFGAVAAAVAVWRLLSGS
jgi:hypothetical protein